MEERYLQTTHLIRLISKVYKEHIPLRLAQGTGPEMLMELLDGKKSQNSQKWKPHRPFWVISALKH